MAKTKWNLLFATFILSCVSLATLIVALCTPYWVTAEAYERDAYKNSEINYGLFAGSLTQNFLRNPRYYDLACKIHLFNGWLTVIQYLFDHYMFIIVYIAYILIVITFYYFIILVTCLYHEYVCAYSCQADEESRSDEILRLLKGLRPLDCPARTSKTKLYIDEMMLSYTRQSEEVFERSNFINTGLWVSTVVFLGIAISFAALSVSFSIINVLFNPVEPIFSVFGMYIWNGVTIASGTLTMIMWGALFGNTLSNNIAITDTLTIQIPYSSTGLASLGASYWILFVPILLHGVNEGLLIWRFYIINKEPPPTTIDVDRSDLTIIMY